MRPLIAFAAVTAAVFGPFALVGWDGLWESLHAQAAGGSTAAFSRDLAGSVPDALALATTLLQVGAVLVVLWVVVRSRVERERLVAGSGATVAGFLAFAKFISPQYLLWLLPLVPLVLAPFALVASGLLAAAMVLGQLWFFRYRELFAVEVVAWLVVA